MPTELKIQMINRSLDAKIMIMRNMGRGEEQVQSPYGKTNVGIAENRRCCCDWHVIMSMVEREGHSVEAEVWSQIFRASEGKGKNSKFSSKCPEKPWRFVSKEAVWSDLCFWNVTLAPVIISHIVIFLFLKTLFLIHFYVHKNWKGGTEISHIPAVPTHA